MSDLTELTASELLAAFRDRDASPVEALDAVAERIVRVDDALGAFTTLCLERARREHSARRRRYQSGSPGGLAGVPLGVKDLFDTEGVRTTYYGSPMFGTRPSALAPTRRRGTRCRGDKVGPFVD